jgi:hypothetical protein
VLKVLQPIWTEHPETASRSAGESSRYSTGPRRAGIATATIRHGGVAICETCFRQHRGYAASSITPPCPIPRSAPS